MDGKFCDVELVEARVVLLEISGLTSVMLGRQTECDDPFRRSSHLSSFVTRFCESNLISSSPSTPLR